MVYLVVQDAVDKGVYAFEHRGVAEEISRNFSTYIFMHDDELEKALKLVASKEAIDGIFLVRKYRSQKNRQKNLPVKENVQVSHKNDIPENKFQKLYSKLSGMTTESLRLITVSGDQYMINLKSLFFFSDKKEHKNIFIVSNGNVTINEPEVDKLISSGIIGVLPKSRIEYIDDFVLISNCDDKYSPDIVQNKNGEFAGYKNKYSKVAIDINKIESVALASLPDLGDKVITSEILIKYLVRKML